MAMTAGERRIVSVLVADVVGSTTIGEKLGPERSKFLFDEITGLMREEVERFRGTVAQLTGDGVLALFGAPVAHEDDSERAVRAALAIREAAAAYGREVEEAYGIDLSTRVAVNTGPVVVPERDEPPEHLYNALGDTVNIAARLQALGDVVLGPETARQLVDRFELEPLGEAELKGKAAPVAAFRVTGEREEPAEIALSPLVGREAELEVLEEVFSALVDGRGAIVALAGEPGIGKSRLKTEARERFGDRVRFLEGHAASYTEEIPYWPLRELLRAWLDLGVSDPEARVRLELRAGLASTLGDDAEDVYPFLATVLGLPLDTVGSDRLSDLSRDSVQQQTFDALSRLARALTRERPLCLVFEDLQWADEATLSLVEELLLLTDEEAVALVLTYRTEQEHGAWDLVELARRRYRHRFCQIELAPLPRNASLELASGAAEAELPETVRDLLAERSGGNPFFLEEALRDLIERGMLRRRNGHLELVDEADGVTVPAAVQEALQARLDRLEPSTREVIGLASVVGRSFGTPLLERVAAPETLRPALSELQRLDLVVEERRRPAPEYRFRHGLVQEVAYGTLLGPQRRELHKAVGEALESIHGESLEEVYGLLARHFAEADEPERAVDYLLKSGDAARALYADEEAVELYGRALEFLERTGDEARARETLLKLGLAHHLAFEFERANEAYGQAFARPEPEPLRLEPGERMRVGSVVPDSVVPGRCYITHSAELCRHLYRGLLGIGPDLEVLPDLARAFTVSPDGKTYRFSIREDARWSDGKPVTAGDFAFTWASMREEGVPSAHLLDGLESAKAHDDRMLEVWLREPASCFLHLLAHPAFFAWPRHICERSGADWHAHRPLVGNGPFIATDLDERRARFVASPTWYGGRGNLRELELEFHPTDTEVLEEWKAGRYDAAPFSGRVGDGDMTICAGMGTFFVGLRTDRSPIDDVRVRRALAHAIDRRRYADCLQGRGVFGDSAGAGGLVPPTVPGHSHRVAPEYDPERARALLAQAGYAEGNHVPELVIGDIEDWFHADEIAEQLADVGVRARVISKPHEEFQDLIEGDIHAWVAGWVADFPDPAGVFLPLLAGHPIIYRDVEIETLVERARSLRDQDERLATYREIDRLLVGHHVALVPLLYGERGALVRPWVKNFWMNALATSTFAEVVIDR